MAEAGTEDAIVAAGHSFEEARGVCRVVRHAAIDFENPIAASGEGFAVAADVGVDNAAVLGRPDDMEARVGGGDFFEKLAGAVFRDAVDYDEERDLPERECIALGQ